MKRTWTKETAERAISDNRGENKTIYLDGKMTLKQCSAADYLANHCGYIFREKQVLLNE